MANGEKEVLGEEVPAAVAEAKEEEEEEEEEKWLNHYSSSQQILLVGEGDFSFSLCLAKAFGSAFNIVASSLDSYGDLLLVLFCFISIRVHVLFQFVYVGLSLFMFWGLKRYVIFSYILCLCFIILYFMEILRLCLMIFCGFFIQLNSCENVVPWHCGILLCCGEFDYY